MSDRLGLAWQFEQMEEVFLSPFRVNEPLLALLGDLDTRLRLALFTDNSPLLRDAIPRRFAALHARFDPLIFSCDLGAVKSDRGAFGLALDRLHAPPEEVLFIDDVPAHVEAARTAGLRAYRFTSASDLRDHLARQRVMRVQPEA